MNKELLTTTRDWMNPPAVVPVAVSRPDYSVEPQAGSVLDYWHTICQRKLLLVIFAIVGLLAGIGVTLQQTPVYRAKTTLEIQDVKDDALAIKILNPVPDSAPVDTLTDIQTQIKILQSQTLIERALDKAQESSPASITPHPAETAWWRRILPLPAADQSRDSLAEEAAKNLRVSAAGQTRIVEVSFDAAESGLAARFANALTAEFIEQNLQARWQMNRRTSEWLVGQLDDLRGKLQHSEDALQAYARQAGLMYTGDKQTISEEKLRQLQVELSRAQADRVEKQSRFEIARNAAPETVPEIINDANLRAMEASLTELQRQQAELGVTFKPDYVKAKRIRAEIEALESAIDTKRTAIVNRIDNELQESRGREQLLAAAYAKQTRLVTDDSEKSIQYDMLKHDVDTNRQIYQVMLQRVKESTIASAMKVTNVRVIDPAKPPKHPYKPSLPLNSAAGLLCGIVSGIVAIVIRTRTDTTVQEPGETGMLLGVPELGVIPAAGGGQRRIPSVLTLFPQGKNHDNRDLQVIPASAKSQALADSFRAVLASIIFAGAKQRQRVLVITSAGPAEGKTSTATNLAITLANMNRRVLLIDGDIRSPRLHHIFGLDNSTGLTNMLTRLAINDTAIDNSIQETAYPNLHVLSSGPAIQTGADLLFSTSMPALIARYREQFDMVVIDTPPMLLMPDARVLGRMADAVVLIARAGKTTRNEIQAAFRRFVEDHTPVLGVVLNDWKVNSSAYKYYAAYRETPVAQPYVKVMPTGTV